MYPNSGRLFAASCLALITSAFSFQMRQDIGDDVGMTFGLTKELVGAIMGGQFLGMALSMLVFSPLCDPLGMGKVLALAWLCHLVGISGTVFSQEVVSQGFAPGIANALSGLSRSLDKGIGFSPLPSAGADQVGFWVLWLAAFFTGSGNGLLEISVNPLAATLYPREKTHKLNVLHAWWPGGLVFAGLLALYAINPLYTFQEGKVVEFFGNKYSIDPAKFGLGEFVTKVASWKFKYALVYIPLALYGLLAVGQRFPSSERVAANVSTGEMFGQIFRPLFIIWAFCMLLTATTELAPNSWMQSIITRTADVSGTLVLVYITSLMFILRFFAGPIAHVLSPIGMLFGCSILTAGGLYWLSQVDTPILAFAAATLFAFGIAFYWPTMLGVTAERFPRGGALVLGLMGCVGNLALSQTTPMLGAIYDSYSAKSLPEGYAEKTVSKTDANGDAVQVPLVVDEPIPKWMPNQVTKRIYPAGGKKINPAAVSALTPPKGADGKPQPGSEEYQKVVAAQTEGARWAFRWTTVLPATLVVIFGLIALVDLLRGGYRAERLDTL